MQRDRGERRRTQWSSGAEPSRAACPYLPEDDGPIGQILPGRDGGAKMRHRQLASREPSEQQTVVTRLRRTAPKQSCQEEANAKKPPDNGGRAIGPRRPRVGHARHTYGFSDAEKEAARVAVEEKS